MNLVITKELYKDMAPIDAMIAGAKHAINHRGWCGSVKCRTCFLSRYNLVVNESLCNIIGGGVSL